MAEINTISKRSRPLHRPPLMAPVAGGVELYERLNLPHYQPPISPEPSQEAISAVPFHRQEPLPLPRTAPVRISLNEFLANNPALPTQSVILGLCEDGLPVLLDLNDPAPGSLLIVGDERPEQLQLLRSAIASVAMRNTARGVQFLVFSHLPGAWHSWVTEQGYERFCLDTTGADDSKAREWIERLADWAEQRRMGQLSGPPILLLMDTLNFIPRLEPDLRARFESLVKEGSQACIWPIAAISTALANSLARQIGIFQTLVFGYTEKPAFYARMAAMNEVEAQSFGMPGRFAVKVTTDEGVNWLKFHLPPAL